MYVRLHPCTKTHFSQSYTKGVCSCLQCGGWVVHIAHVDGRVWVVATVVPATNLNKMGCNPYILDSKWGATLIFWIRDVF